jgi:hypothetical protein
METREKFIELTHSLRYARNSFEKSLDHKTCPHREGARVESNFKPQTKETLKPVVSLFDDLLEQGLGGVKLNHAITHVALEKFANSAIVLADNEYLEIVSSEVDLYVRALCEQNESLLPAIKFLFVDKGLGIAGITIGIKHGINRIHLTREMMISKVEKQEWGKNIRVETQCMAINSAAPTLFKLIRNATNVLIARGVVSPDIKFLQFEPSTKYLNMSLVQEKFTDTVLDIYNKFIQRFDIKESELEP